MVRAENLYISASTNRYSHAASVSSSSLVVFASQKFLALWDPSDIADVGVSATIPGHEAEVNCVKVLGNDVIFSGDQRGILQIRIKKSGKWILIVQHTAHSKPISTLTAYENLIVTGSSDATVKIWKFTRSDDSNGVVDLLQVLDMERQFPLDAQLTSFPETSCLILAIASTGRDINIWSRTDTEFVYSASLSGHEDWVSSLAFTRSLHPLPKLTLASGSQDGTIRLWTMERIIPTRPNITDNEDIFDAFETSEDFSETEEGGRQMSTKRHVIPLKSVDGTIFHISIVFDALLVGHEAGVTSVSWRPDSSTNNLTPTLLSTSVDSSLIMWSPTSIPNASEAAGTASLWINKQRFGDVGGQRLGGFVGGFWDVDGNEALAWGWNGGWRRWRCVDVQEGRENWNEVGAITGHQGVVKSLAWVSNGDYLLSTGLDQTARIHGPHRRYGMEESRGEAWHELARPQVHGYDIVGAEFLSPLRFVSIADEKVARVFDAPKNFVSTVNELGTVIEPFSMDDRPSGANVPPLGLSNKAINNGEPQRAVASNTSLRGRYPYEGELASATLWPEVEKIFGHGYELISLATSHSGSLVVTACKSSTAEHAVLRVYSTRDWQPLGDPLQGHTLTVTRITFSPDDTFILSVSRDRAWRLYHRNPDNDGYTLLAMDKSHSRIIWDSAWVHETSETVFATASRDKTVKIWQPVNSPPTQWSPVATLKFKEAATAIDFSPLLIDGRRRLAIGLESGQIFIYSSKTNTSHEWTLDMKLDPLLSHVDSVHRVLWKPTKNKGNRQQIATCSEDRTLKVMTVHLDFH